jgi:hypothetical protein
MLRWWQRGPSSGTCFTSMPFDMLGQVVGTHETACTHVATKLLLTSMCTLVPGELVRTREPAPAPVPLACKRFLSYTKKVVLVCAVGHYNSPTLWKLKAHYNVHRSLSPIPILKIINSTHILPPNVLKIRISHLSHVRHTSHLSPSLLKHGCLLGRCTTQSDTSRYQPMFLSSLLPPSSGWVVRSSEIYSTRQVTWCNVPENSHLHTDHCENLTSLLVLRVQITKLLILYEVCSKRSRIAGATSL